MKSLEDALKSTIQGDVHFDEITRHVYSVDASIFEVTPMGVVIPKDAEDLKAIITIAKDFQIPITIRGAATGITGGCLGRGLIIDLSKFFTKIEKIDLKNKAVVCQPGVVQDDLNKELHSFSYRLGPDTSTGNRATLGGMLANNAAGARSLRFGKMVDHVLEVELLIGTGELCIFKSLSENEWLQKCQLPTQEGVIYKTLLEIRNQHRGIIQQHFPPIPRRVSGYNLDELIKPFPLNVSKVIAGSEGTLGIVTKMKMAIVPKPICTGLILLFFEDMTEAFHAVPNLLSDALLSFEMIDRQIIELGRASPSMRNRLDWLKGNPEAIFILEVDGVNLKDLKEKLEKLHEEIKDKQIGTVQIPIVDPKIMNEVWNLRKAGLGLLLSKRTYHRAIAFLEDISIPPLQLGPFMAKFCNYLSSHGKNAGIYGHVGSGCMHIRPYLDLRNQNEVLFMRQMMLDISSLLLEFGGALSGEHGDGLIRSWLNPKMFGSDVMALFQQVKKAFDPDNLMNPNKIVPLTVRWEEFRTESNKSLESPPTYLDYSAEGGYALAIDLCNGNGLCRKREGIMCPSFQATNDEFHSTRARAQSLRAIIHNRLPIESLTSEGMYKVMDLCISCKGCKTECPSQIDMAKFKSEFLYQYQEKHGYSIRNRLFGRIGQLNAFTSYFSRLFNYLKTLSWSKKWLNLIGISSKRNLPSLASERFSHWFQKYEQLGFFHEEVVLMNDTFTEFNSPEIGKATVLLLNALGFFVILSPWKCCGRPAFSKGMLELAREQAEQLKEVLFFYREKNYPIIGLEPSCTFTLRDDYLSLLKLDRKQEEELKNLISRVYLLDEFLAQLIDRKQFNKTIFKEEEQAVKVHGHCYQKALIGMSSTIKVLKECGFFVEEIPSGCCGMAGSFGYESEHESISMKIGELVLFPEIRKMKKDVWLIANGMSCRHQIQDGTERQALHLAEALFSKLKVK